MYGFHKGKNEDGCDIFGEKMFVKGKKEFLIFIERNQKKKNPRLIDDGKLKSELIVEICKIQEQQKQVELALNGIQLKNDDDDFRFQTGINKYYHQ